MAAVMAVHRLVIALLCCLAATAWSAEPAPQPPADAPVKDATQGDDPRIDESKIVVYITRTGARYHRATCRYAKIASTLKEAKAAGYTPCQVCRP